MILESIKFLKNLDTFATALKGVLKEPLIEIAHREFHHLLQNDIKYLMRKDVKEYRARAIVNLGQKWALFVDFGMKTSDE